MENKFSYLLSKEQILTAEKSKLETSVKEYQTKKSNIIKSAHEIIAELKQLENTQITLSNLDFTQIELLTEQIVANKERAAQHNLSIQNDMARIEKLKKPIPKDGECEECRQIITDEHRTICQTKLTQEFQQRQQNIINYKKSLADLTAQNNVHQQSITQLKSSKQQLDNLITKIATKQKEVADKKNLHEEYKITLEDKISSLNEKNKELQEVVEALKNSAVDEAKNLQKQIQEQRQYAADNNIQISTVNKEMAHFNSMKTIIQHDIVKKTEDKVRKAEYQNIIKELDAKLITYPSVIQAFSSTGIPNLIIQNVLDDLQVEANRLLSQLKPGMQLSFFD